LIALSTVWIGLGKETEDLFRLPWAIWLCKCWHLVSVSTWRTLLNCIVGHHSRRYNQKKKTIVRTSTLHKVHAGFLRFDEGTERDKDKMINKQRKKTNTQKKNERVQSVVVVC
jgi:hypothetical protein